MSASPFLTVSPRDWIASNAHAFAIFDGFPVSSGHALIVTKRLVATWFDATPAEQAAVMQLVSVVKQQLDAALQPRPDGYNVGFNSGQAAGQTVDHLHVHVIPRYRGDVEDPRGGVRHVIPAKANYLAGAPNRNATAQAVRPSNPPDRNATAQAVRPRDGAAAPGPPAQRANLMSGQGNALDDATPESPPSPTGAALLAPAQPASPTEHHAGVLLDLSTGHPDSPLWDQLSWRIAGASQVDVLASFVQLSRLEVISFHPKAWHIVEDGRVFVSVGSSNLSRPALHSGIEWNLLSSGSPENPAHAQVAAEFQSLWRAGSLLTPELVAQYAAAAAKYRRANFIPQSIEPGETIPSPRPWQVEALAALQRLRAAGHRRALVAVATGMGKTWLAAFDACQFGTQHNRRPRVLVIAHRAHILAQAEAALALMLDHTFTAGTTAWYIGDRSELAGDLVVASVQKLSRPEGLERLAQEHFDYVVMDEVHHAHAPSYRRVLAKLRCYAASRT